MTDVTDEADDQRTESGNRAQTGFERASATMWQVGRVVFGDRKGLALFLGAVLWLAALWRIGIWIKDTYVVANAMANVASGQLALIERPYTEHVLGAGSLPGMFEVGGQTYGRNYGHILLALPVLYLLEGLSALAAPKLLLAGGWSLGLVALGSQVAKVTGRRQVRTVASAVALLVFAGNVAAARTLPSGVLELVALQLTTILVGGYLAVLLYRLVERFHGWRVGVVAGIAVVIATPIGFWASIPKRHVVTAATALLVLYLFAVSREGTDRRQVLARAGAYATLGLLTTVHPFEAFFLFVVLVVVDLATAPANSPRALGAVALLFACSMLPFFILNTLISGNPIGAPRVIDKGFGIVPGLTDGGGGGGGAPAPGDGSGSASGTGVVATAVGAVTTGVEYTWHITAYAAGWLTDGLSVLSEPGRLSDIFFRSGGIMEAGIRSNSYEAIELTLLESFPLLAALVWLPVEGVQALRARTLALGLSTPRRQTDLLAVGFVAILVVVYLPRLPLHSQITARYILPVVPLLVYALVRLSVVRRMIRERPRWLVGGYLATVGAGVVGMSLALATLELAVGEAMQLHALLGLATAAIMAVAVGSWPLHRRTRMVALGTAIPAGMTTVFLVFAKIEYFGYSLPIGDNPHVYALDLVRLLAKLLPG